jgi:hypothetical protein
MPSPGMWRYIYLVRTVVSEDSATSFCRVERIIELGTILAIASKLLENW